MECNFENCGYYADGDCNICGMGISGEDTFCRLCKDNPNCYYKQNLELKAENERLKEDNANKLSIVNKFLEENNMLKIYKDKYYQQTLDDEIKLNELYQTLQEIKGVVTALYMNNWLQMNETARKSIQLLQDLITKAEEK